MTSVMVISFVAGQPAAKVGGLTRVPVSLRRPPVGLVVQV